MKILLYVLALSLSGGTIAAAQTVIRLYDGKAPGSESWTGSETVTIDSLSKNSVVYNVVTPTITAFLPNRQAATGTSVLLFPGVDRAGLLVDQEGTTIAKQLAANGIAAFVVKYRFTTRAAPAGPGQIAALSQSDSLAVLSMALADGSKALDYLHAHATELGVNPDRIGLLGVSTAGMLALRLVRNAPPAYLPAFVGLINPHGIKLAPGTISARAIPLFIVATTDVATTDVATTDVATTDVATTDVATTSVGATGNRQAVIESAQVFQDWLKAGFPAEFHSYSSGNHRAVTPTQQSATDVWVEPFANWLSKQIVLPAPTVPQPVPMRSQDSVAPKPENAPSPVIQPNLATSSSTKPDTTSALLPSRKPAPLPKPAGVVLVGRKASSAASQSNLPQLSGIVRDSASGRPLAGVAIVVDYRKYLTGTNTDANGRFSIGLTPDEHTVVARLVGYTPVRKIVSLQNGPLTITINMVTVASQLEEVVVTTKGFDQTVREPLLGVNQISLKTLEKLPSALGEVDLLRGLQSLPGVTSVGEASNGVNIRGGTTDQNLILLDGTPIFNPTHMFGLFSVFPPDVLNTVDLYKGNVPARFGGRAASVLDVSLRNPTLDGFRLSGGVSVVSNKLTVDIPIVKGKAALMIAGRGAFNDFLLPVVSDRLAGIKARFGDGVVKGFWRVNDRNTLTATGYFSKDLFQTALLANLPNVNGTATRYDHQTLNLMARWFHTLSDRANLQTTALLVHYIPKILSPELNSTNVVTLRSSVLQRQFQSNLNVQSINQKLEVGVSGTHYRIEPGTLLPGQSDQVNYITTPTENGLELALHADYELSISPRLAVSAGLRYSEFLALGPSLVRQYRPGEPRDDFSVIDSTRYGPGQITAHYGGPEPRLGIRYSLGANASVKFGYNLMRQYLQVVTNTTTPLPTSRYKTSDANVQPQVSQLVTAGYFLNFHQNVYELTLEGYYRATQHIIDYRPGADFLLQPYPETQLLQGRSQAYGIETMISKKKGELTGWINYTYARSLNQVYEGPGVEQNINRGSWYRANYDRPHTVNASMTIDVDKHNSFGLTFAYSTGRPYTAPTGFVSINGAQFPYYGVRNEARLPDYHRMDFTWNIYNASMRARRWEGRWSFTVYNLYGRKNAYSVFFRTENGKANAYQLQIFASPIASLSYNFVFK